MWRYLAISTLAFLTGCAELPPSGTVSVPGSPPRTVVILLGSQIQRVPYSPEELADPAIQSIIAECERQGATHCRQPTELANVRTKFDRAQDDMVAGVVILGGLESNRDYTVRFKLFDPNGDTRMRATISVHIPPSFPAQGTIQPNFCWVPPDPSTWQLGSWRVEVAVNGEVEGERTFEVVG